MTPLEARTYIASLDPAYLLVSTSLSDGEAVSVAAMLQGAKGAGIVSGLLVGLVVAGVTYGSVRYGLPELRRRGLVGK